MGAGGEVTAYFLLSGVVCSIVGMFFVVIVYVCWSYAEHCE